MPANKKIAIVYDWIDKWGGVERVLLNLHEMFPEAVFYTSYFDNENAQWAKDLNIKTSFLQNFPDFIKKSRILSLIFYPFAFESFNFSEFNLVISVTSSFGKSVITKPGTRHICYLLTPTRYLWSHRNDYIKNKTLNFLVSGYLGAFKNWDLVAAQRPDKIISISETVKKRVKKYYKRDSEVIYPGFDRAYWEKIKSQITNDKSQVNDKYYLIVSRLEPYKKIDLAVKAFNKLNKKLIIVGKGTEENRLKAIAGENINFISKVSDVELAGLYSNAEALIMPQEEDFGYTALEAQFFGCPVVAYRRGGAIETVIEGKTGIFFTSSTRQSLTRAVERYDKIKYNLRKDTAKFGIINIDKFSKEKFIEKFLKNL